jgi:hypothetical protein
LLEGGKRRLVVRREEREVISSGVMKEKLDLGEMRNDGLCLEVWAKLRLVVRREEREALGR